MLNELQQVRQFALSISGMPFHGPIGAARVGHIDGQLVLNPSPSELESSRLDLVVSGTEGAVLMVESEADVLSEAEMLSAVVYGHEQQQTAIKAINEFAAEVGTPAWDWAAPAVNASLKAQIAELAEARLTLKASPIATSENRLSTDKSILNSRDLLAD